MNNPNSQPILEVIACSVADAIAAERGGADRLEIIARFDKGGMTPPIELVEKIIASVSLPVRVMIRETEEFAVTDESIVEKLCQAAGTFSKLPIDGLVLGFVRESRIDLELTRRVLSHAPNMKATFHHAFEELDDPIDAIRELKSLPQIDRILTKGGVGEWDQKIKRLGEYQRVANPEIVVLAGGGLDKQLIRNIRGAKDICEYHVGRAVRLPATVDGEIQPALVNNIVRVLR